MTATWLNTLNTLRSLKLVVEFEWRSIVADRAGLLRMIVIEPLTYLLILGMGLQGLIHQFSYEDKELSYLSFIVPGVVAMQLLRMFAYSIYRLTIDRRWGLQALKIAAGVSRTSYVAGMLILPAGLLLLQSTVCLVVASLLGVKSDLGGIVGMLLIGVISSTFWSSLAIAITFFVKSYAQRDMWLAFLLLPLTFSAPIFYPLDSAPSFLQVVSYLNPLSYQVQAMRDAFLLSQFSLGTWGVVIATGFILVIARCLLEKAEFLPRET